MKTGCPSPEQGNQHWGIYHSDRAYARTVGDPLRTVIQAPTEPAAEELAARLGFSDPWIRSVTQEQICEAQWFPVCRLGDRQALVTRHRKGICV